MSRRRAQTVGPAQPKGLALACQVLLDRARRFARAGSRANNQPEYPLSTEGLLSLLRAHAPDVCQHMRRTARLSGLLASRLEVSDRVLELTIRAAELHDVGKLALPRYLLVKRQPLSESEWRLMRQQTLLGERLLECVPEARGVAGIVRASHERYDGAGYPDGLAGKEIPLSARIVAVCDAFDAMTQAGEYRTALSAHGALAQIKHGAGTQFDPEVASEFCKALRVLP
jgi:two-component system cell cycle response regulator